MKYHPMYRRVHTEAKQLLKGCRKGDPAALAVVHAAYPKAAPTDPAELEDWLKLQRVQHALAVSKGAKNWVALLEEVKKEWAESKVADMTPELPDTEEFACAMASTNACFFIVDDTEIMNIDIDEYGTVRIDVSWSATGDQIDDKPFCGNIVHGRSMLLVDPEGRTYWDEISASVDDSWAEPDYEDRVPVFE